MNRHERRKLESLGSGVYKGKHRGSKPGFSKGSFGSPGINVPKKETGRGNFNEEQLENTKKCLRQHPEGVAAVQVAEAVGVSQARAARLLDLLSGGQDGESGQDFLISMDDDENPPLYFISKDGGEK